MHADAAAETARSPVPAAAQTAEFRVKPAITARAAVKSNARHAMAPAASKTDALQSVTGDHANPVTGLAVSKMHPHSKAEKANAPQTAAWAVKQAGNFPASCWHKTLSHLAPGCRAQ